MINYLKNTKLGYFINSKKRAFLSTYFPEIATKQLFNNIYGKELNLSNPRDINEKIQYLKLNDYYNNPLITQCVDKWRVRQYLKDIGRESLLVDLLAGPFDNAEQLRGVWDSLPNKFVIKCNHGCGYNILVTKKTDVSINDVIKTLDGWMKEKFWKKYCETQYRFVIPTIIIERYLGDEITTYKFYCFNGSPKVLYLSSNGENGEKDLYLDYYDLDMNWLDITLGKHKHSNKKAEKPQNFDQMIMFAKELSSPFPFVRIDLYNVDNHIYFSEFTFVPTGGFMRLSPTDYSLKWGNMLKL